ncbi:unnamed protein product [Leuciscus chuanchicus]
MKPSVFYGKRVNAQPHVRAPPEESEDSCLSDSAGSDEEYVPKPGDEESCSESDRSSSVRSSSSEEEVQDQDAGSAGSDGECVPEPGDEESNRSKFPMCTGHTSFKCTKCDVHLCLNKNKNCFCAFHE